MQQLLTESLLLALVGGALGVAAGVLDGDAVRRVAARRRFRASISSASTAGSLAFAALLSMVTGIVFGLVPALRASTPDLLSALKQAGRGGGTAPSRRFRAALVVVEVALALVLLVGAGLMIRSFARLMAIEPGFDPDDVVTMRLTLPPAKYRELERWTAFHEELVRTGRRPSLASRPPGSTAPCRSKAAARKSGVHRRGPADPAAGRAGDDVPLPGEQPGLPARDGHSAAQGPVLHDARQRAASTPVAIVDETLVRRLFPDEDPLGKRIAFEFRGDRSNPDPLWREIVGVVRHVRHYGLASGAAVRPDLHADRAAADCTSSSGGRRWRSSRARRSRPRR